MLKYTDLSGQIILQQYDIIASFHHKSFKEYCSIHNINTPGILELIPDGYNLPTRIDFFDDCDFIKEVNMDARIFIPNLKAYTFKNCNLEKITVGKEIGFGLPSAARFNRNAEIIIDERSKYVDRIDNFYLSTDGTQLYGVVDKDEEITVPDSVTTIEEYAFENTKNIKTVKGKNIQYIEMGAFENSQVKSVDFPKCKYVRENAFKNSPVTELYAPNLRTLPSSFSGSNIRTFFIKGERLKNGNSFGFLHLPSDSTVYTDEIPMSLMELGHNVEVKRATLDELIELNKPMTEVNDLTAKLVKDDFIK